MYDSVSMKCFSRIGKPTQTEVDEWLPRAGRLGGAGQGMGSDCSDGYQVSFGDENVLKLAVVMAAQFYE